MNSAALRGQLIALAFVHPMFIWLAVGAVMMGGLDRPAGARRDRAPS